MSEKFMLVIIMIKIPLSISQIESILKWRDSHKDLVRSYNIPFNEVEIISENGIKVRVSRNQIIKSVYRFVVSDTINNIVKGRFDYAVYTGLVTHNYPRLSSEDTQSAITIWASTMAYILNFEQQVLPAPADNGNRKTKKKRHGKSKSSNNRTIYLNPIKFIKEKEEHQPRSYTSPSHSFYVRGHYRHMKSGKTVYVKPYQKNKAHEPEQTNRILKISNTDISEN